MGTLKISSRTEYKQRTTQTVTQAQVPYRGRVDFTIRRRTLARSFGVLLGLYEPLETGIPVADKHFVIMCKDPSFIDQLLEDPQVLEAIKNGVTDMLTASSEKRLVWHKTSTHIGTLRHLDALYALMRVMAQIEPPPKGRPRNRQKPDIPHLKPHETIL